MLLVAAAVSSITPAVARKSCWLPVSVPFGFCQYNLYIEAYDGILEAHK
jgi:hypothetical protein